MNRKDRPGLGLRAWMLLLAAASAMPLVLSLGYAFAVQTQQQQLAQDILLRERAGSAAAIVGQRLRLMSAFLRSQSASRALEDGNLADLYRDATRLIASQRSLTAFEITDSGADPLFRVSRTRGQAQPPVRRWSCQADHGMNTPTDSLTSVNTGLKGEEGWNAVLSQRIAVGPLAGCRMQVTGSLKEFGDSLRTIQWPGEWVAAVIDADFRIVARSAQAESYVGLTATEPLKNAIRQGGNRAFDGIALDGRRVLAYTVSLPGGHGWHLGVGVAEDVIGGELRSSTLRFLGLAGAAVAFAFASALFLASRISRAIRGLASPMGTSAREGVGLVQVREAHAVAEILAGSRASLETAAHAQQEMIRELEAENAHRVQVEQRLKSVQARLMEAQESEQRFIARELHDELGQELALLQMMLKSMRTRPEITLRMLADCEAGVVRLSDRVRSLALSLRPSQLDDLGLGSALLGLARVSQGAGEPAVEVVVPPGNRRYPPHAETALFRVAQAATTNAMRHANAHTIRIVLAIGSGCVRIMVSDDGDGFDPDRPPTKGPHLGLLIMRERMEGAGGSLDIASGPGGTTVTASIPLDLTGKTND